MLFLGMVTIVLCLAAPECHAQRKSKGKKKEVQQQDQPTSVDPAKVNKTYAPKRKKEGPVKVTYDAQKNWKARKAELKKTRLKNERQADLNDISKPPYFGHKKPPKKNPPDKMKYCRTCGIRH